MSKDIIFTLNDLRINKNFKVVNVVYEFDVFKILYNKIYNVKITV